MKKILFTLVAFLLALSIVYAASSMYTLNFINAEHSDAYGKAKVSVKMKKGLYDVEIRLQLIDLAKEQGQVYEGWLVDEDSGYKLSMGAFAPSNAGRANYKFKQQMVNFMIYDEIVITRESSNDENPMPNEVVLTTSLDVPLPQNPYNFVANLNSEQEASESDSIATGTGSFIIDTEANTLSYIIDLQNLEGEEMSVHFHGPADLGEDANVIHTLPNGNHKEGVWHYSEPHEADILQGKTYVNVHTTTFPDGEIRGQILPA